MTENSLEYAKKHKQEFTDSVTQCKEPNDEKVAIFMAGTPGAGKTEFATTLELLFGNLCVIDADKFRVKFPDYNGKNSSEFQAGASWLVDHCLTYCLKKNYSFLLDTTFSIQKSVTNIERAINRDYDVKIYYVYQLPKIAWNFTKIREAVEGRYVPKEVFVKAYYQAIQNIIEVKHKFNGLVELNVVFKDYENNVSEIIYDVSRLELLLPTVYTLEELEEIIND